MIINNEPLRASIMGLGPPVGGGMAKTRLGGIGEFERIFGTEDEFMERYRIFQELYLQKLETNLDPVKARNVDLDFLRSGGSINLNVLEKKTAKELRERYNQDVLRLPTLFKSKGLPGVELPSANLFRRLFKYEIDTSRNNRSNASYASSLK